ncbi:hydroxysteroid dehydrogenase-like protein 2 [Plakobranchus ocellatus]|uniref:Hydroxysteroid dehydrogenase-like protein 2 n=1 Tax=Plakobranchus ocellatus TaxID=259542 RepID=A0AAV4BA79_9GAST|nr:hydroxysteroid dehydrogenase-like protein 2 [Plakobranchus ocellatus]
MAGKAKSALILGATRGIGKQIALTFAENGYKVCVAAKTTESTPRLPGTIHDVVTEIEEKGGEAFPARCDVRSEEDIRSTLSQCMQKFGGVDVAVYNAGAISWQKVAETPLRRWDLMNQVNARGAFCLVNLILPHMLEKKHGRLILVAPPVYNRFFKGKTPYAMSKVAMTVLVHGLANELAGVTISALWPATVIESHVTTLMKLPPCYMRKATIFADACLEIAQEESEILNGKALIDEDYLKTKGMTDFSKYRVDPEEEPNRMMPRNFPNLVVKEELDDKQITSKL